MKFGLLTAILDGMTYEEAVDFASANGLECLEVACWPAGKAERRYAGVSHIDAERVLADAAYARHILEYAQERGVTLSSLAYYPNPLDADADKRAQAIGHLTKLIEASSVLGVNMVTTFIGRDQYRTVEENYELVKAVWPPILDLAKQKGVRVAIENCPMLFGDDQWPGGQNLMTTPAIWRKMFELLPYENFGINYDPSHFVWQQIDYIRPLYEFKDKIFHVHFKDIKLYPEKLKDVGVMAAPLSYMSPKLPGLGDVDWGRYVSALTDIGFDGCAVIEVEDKAFEKDLEDAKRAVLLSQRYLKNFIY